MIERVIDEARKSFSLIEHWKVFASIKKSMSEDQHTKRVVECLWEEGDSSYVDKETGIELCAESRQLNIPFEASFWSLNTDTQERALFQCRQVLDHVHHFDKSRELLWELVNGSLRFIKVNPAERRVRWRLTHCYRYFTGWFDLWTKGSNNAGLGIQIKIWTRTIAAYRWERRLFLNSMQEELGAKQDDLPKHHVDYESLKAFFQDTCGLDAACCVSVRKFFDGYIRWANKHGHTPVSARQLVEYVWSIDPIISMAITDDVHFIKGVGINERHPVWRSPVPKVCGSSPTDVALLHANLQLSNMKENHEQAE